MRSRSPKTIARLARIAARRFSQAVSNVVERVVDKEALIRVDQTPYEVIHRDGILSVLHYLPLCESEIVINRQIVTVQRQRHPIPLVCIPPLFAPHFAFDLVPERSLVRFFLSQGFRVYLIDFGNPTRDHSHLSFKHYILDWMPAALKAVRDHSNENSLSLLGYCMGGVFALLYAAVHLDEEIRNIVTVGSPIDMHQAGVAGKVFSVMGVPAHLMAKYLYLDLRKLDPNLLHIPGKLGTLFFYLTNPMGAMRSYWDLLLNLWDRDYVSEHASMSHWIDNLLDYPGATMQELVVQMGLANRLGRKGKMRIGRKMARLENVRAAMLSFAGESDEIVPVRAARRILETIPSKDKTFCVVPGGHLGMIVGSRAPDNMWAITADWLASRSGSSTTQRGTGQARP